MSDATEDQPTRSPPSDSVRPRRRPSRRLEELEHGLFTSDLSVNEFLLIKEVGFHPLGFVMGSSIYHTGIQTRKWGQSQELTKLTEAMYNARELAMTRMEEEAARARCRRRGRRPPRRQLLRVGQGRGRVHRGRHRGQGRERRLVPQQARQAVHLRPLRPGLLDAHADRLRPPGSGDGDLRLPHRPPRTRARRSGRPVRTSSSPTSPRRSTRHASWP